MRILLLVPGTGHYVCGHCLRDDTVGRSLRALGHDALVAPLYLPLYLERGESTEPVHMGGINVYLHEKAPRLAHLTPRVLHDLLDRPGLLRWASRRGDMTDAAELGAMTVSMLRGEAGRQAEELELLAGWARALGRFDALCLSNAMLLGLARRLKEAVGAPVVCSLQGEEPFLDSLPEPHRGAAWGALAERARDADAFVAVSGWYGERMRARLDLDPARLHVVHNGIELDGLEPAAPERARPTIGYLARMCADKGLPTLVEAFVLLKRRPGTDGVRLRVAGTVLRSDEPLVDELRRRLEREGLADAVEFLPNVERDAKLSFLRSLSVLSVPATYGEAFGLYLLEALACGVPVVQPRHGAFPEVLAATGGGVLCEPDDPASLADALADLLADEDRRRALGEAGRRTVRERFTAERMAREVAEVCRMSRGSTG